MTKERRLYDSVQWRKARACYLATHPLCVMCLRVGRERRATVVDHIVDHGGDTALFWDKDNWQSLCATCHSGAKKIQTKHGYSQATDASGFPVDAGHWWNK
jgi:5-methylcytosine-specific restriction protein A